MFCVSLPNTKPNLLLSCKLSVYDVIDDFNPPNIAANPKYGANDLANDLKALSVFLADLAILSCSLLTDLKPLTNCFNEP